MGINALVYVNKKNLADGSEYDETEVDEETGELLVDELQSEFQREKLIAVERRLGNAALIRFLHEEIARLVGLQSVPVLLGQVLYSGTHSGDYISLEDVSRLSQEIALLAERAHGQKTAEIGAQLDALRELVKAAETERNPIVFV